MVKVFALIPRRPDVSDTFFHEHWAGPHAELAQHITTIRRYLQSHRIAAELPALAPAPYNGIAEVWFDDAATAAGMGEDPNYVDYAHADEPNFIDTDQLAFLIGSERWLTAPAPEAPAAAVKAMLLLRRRSACSPQALAEALESLTGFDGDYAHASLTVAIPESYADGAEPPFDAVAEFTYADKAALASDTAALRTLTHDTLAAVVDPDASSALVVRELRVVWPDPVRS